MKRLLLHTCCGPCSTAVFEELKNQFRATGFFYNPNIWPKEEWGRRKAALGNFAKDKNFKIVYLESSKGIKGDRGIKGDKCDKGVREDKRRQRLIEFEYLGKKEIWRPGECEQCYKNRLSKTAEYASKNNFDYFTTTLLISPYQGQEIIKKIGENLAKYFKIKFYYQDFTSYFHESKILSKELGLYRQKYCGCQRSINKSK